MNDAIFSKSFRFRIFQNDTDRQTDNRSGIRCHYFAFLEQGSCRIVTENETITVKSGEIFYLPNGLRYQSFWQAEPVFRFISLGFCYMPNCDGKNFGPQVISRCDRTVALFREIASRSEVDAESIGLFYTLSAVLLPRMVHTAADRRNQLVDFAKKYILDHPEASVSQISRAAAVSESALYLAFQTASEQSVHSYRNSVRMEEARRLLLSSDISVEELSETLRFSSSTYFRKCFKLYFGITPREMRKKCDI